MKAYRLALNLHVRGDGFMVFKLFKPNPFKHSPGLPFSAKLVHFDSSRSNFLIRTINRNTLRRIRIIIIKSI